MINQVTLVGRAGKDPDCKTFNNGKIVCNLSMAIKRPAAGEDKTETDWFHIKLWGKQAEVAQKFLKKGHLFGVIGELREEKWEDNGSKRSKVVVHGNRFILMQPKDKDSDGGSTTTASSDAGNAPDDFDPFAGDEDDGWS